MKKVLHIGKSIRLSEKQTNVEKTSEILENRLDLVDLTLNKHSEIHKNVEKPSGMKKWNMKSYNLGRSLLHYSD